MCNIIYNYSLKYKKFEKRSLNQKEEAMRDIKFRAWDNIENGMHSNIQTGIYEDPDEIIPFGKILEFACYDVMQYTGLKDKQGKEIYEGDLIPYTFNYKKLGIVKYGEYQNICDDEFAGHVGFYVEWQDEQLRTMNRKDLGYWIKVSTVIGNIYENPELLEVGK